MAASSPSRGDFMSERTVELFVGLACPFAWMTSRWLGHTTEVCEFTPRFSVMSLAVLNEGRDLDPGYRRSIDDSWGAARLAIAIDEAEGNAAVARRDTARGERSHVGGDQDDRKRVAEQARSEERRVGEQR